MRGQPPAAGAAESFTIYNNVKLILEDGADGKAGMPDYQNVEKIDAIPKV